MTADFVLENCPLKKFQKKTPLLKLFHNYLCADSKIEHESEDEKQCQVLLCYVKKCIKTPYTIMFRFSNKIVYVRSTGKTKIILVSRQTLITHVNRMARKASNLCRPHWTA